VNITIKLILGKFLGYLEICGTFIHWYESGSIFCDNSS